MANRTKEQSLGLYAEGWSEGNVDKLLESTAPGFQFNDPLLRGV
jgi:hypothetical protein